MKITITKVEFLNQLAALGRRFEKAEVIEQCGDDWDHLTGGANSATLWIRGRNDYFGCYMGSTTADGFFNTYLPIADDLVKKKLGTPRPFQVILKT